MKNPLKEFKKAFKEALEGPSRYRAADSAVSCAHCSHERFERSEAQLNSAGMSFLGLDWANRSANVLVCAKCGYVMWFVGDVEAISDK